MNARFAFLLASLALAAGCGESKRQVIDRYRAPCQAMRQRLAAIAAKLPPAGTVHGLVEAKGLAPLPFYDAAARSQNTEFLMAPQLTEPEREVDPDLMLSADLRSCLLWTGPRNPMAESALASSAGTLDDDFRRGLGWQYLVVVRVARFEPPKLVGADQFTGGKADMEAFLVRASDDAVVGSFAFSAAAAEQVSYSYREKEDPAARAAASVHSSAWSAARSTLADGLTRMTGGTFRFDR